MTTAAATGMRLLGLDVGTRSIGLALSDTAQRVAAPLGVLQRGRIADDARALAELIAARGVGALVIGLPLDMHGGEGPRCRGVRQFARNLQERGVALPVAFWDERLTTVAAERALIREGDVSRRRRAGLRDRMAATLILQGWLDARQWQNRAEGGEEKEG